MIKLAQMWKMATNPTTPIHLLEIMAADEDVYLRRGLARNPGLPHHLLQKLARDPDRFVRRELATNPNLSTALLRRLADDPDPEIQKLIVCHPNHPQISPEHLENLAKTNDIYLRQRVAYNPLTPIHTLLRLGADFPDALLNHPDFADFLENPDLIKTIPIKTLASLVKCPNLSPTILEMASRLLRNDALSLIFIAQNLYTPKAILEKLSQSQDNYISELARLHITFGEAMPNWDKPGINALWNTALNKQKFGEYLESLAQINLIPDYLMKILPKQISSLPHIAPKEILNYRVNTLINTLNDHSLSRLQGPKFVEKRQSIAANAYAPVSLLRQLVDDLDVNVRISLAGNVKVPEDILLRLVGDSAEPVRKIAVPHYLHRQPEGMDLLLQHYPRHQGNSYSYSYLMLLFHHHIPPEYLGKASKSIMWLERYAIACNTKTPEDILTMLGNDCNRIVRHCALATFNKRNKITQSNVPLAWKDSWHDHLVSSEKTYT